MTDEIESHVNRVLFITVTPNVVSSTVWHYAASNCYEDHASAPPQTYPRAIEAVETYPLGRHRAERYMQDSASHVAKESTGITSEKDAPVWASYSSCLSVST
ncbi:hypothetical protein T265_07254 [Opisthorchis viverrini]|uniref:Uncharacterized protein n=1 Tax=Opisthorchis viverrini TaxID=6198 RepID=A0A074ZPM5_OPIVI|nr:hypothetical protein T265_07254 [Opisthorchis viverrini]KER25270.1 hypothetical protein T265_07254 [Opisthorchis viverrini]